MRPYFMHGHDVCWTEGCASASCRFCISRQVAPTIYVWAVLCLHIHAIRKSRKHLYYRSRTENSPHEELLRHGTVGFWLGSACATEPEYSTVSPNQTKHGSSRKKSKAWSWLLEWPTQMAMWYITWLTESADQKHRGIWRCRVIR